MLLNLQMENISWERRNLREINDLLFLSILLMILSDSSSVTKTSSRRRERKLTEKKCSKKERGSVSRRENVALFSGQKKSVKERSKFASNRETSSQLLEKEVV